MTTPHEDYDSDRTISETDPAFEPESAPALPDTESGADHSDKPRSGPTVAGGTWAFLIIGALLLILLLVFILQNQQQAEVNLFAFSWQFPAGVAYLICAIIGALITALVGGWRMFEMRRQIRRAKRR